MSAESFSHSRSKLNDKLNIPTFWELIKTIPTVRSEWHLKTPVRHLKKMMTIHTNLSRCNFKFICSFQNGAIYTGSAVYCLYQPIIVGSETINLFRLWHSFRFCTLVRPSFWPFTPFSII